MTFIVEMWWGEPHELIVQDLDEGGELCDRSVPLPGPPDCCRTFSCSGGTWELAQTLGRAFGWEPKVRSFKVFEAEWPLSLLRYALLRDHARNRPFEMISQ